MSLNFSHHRMNSFSWIEEYKEKLKPEVFFKFIDMVYAWLGELKPGQTLLLSGRKNITNQNRDLFIKTVCLFITEGHEDYEFTNDYTAVIRKENKPIIWNKKKQLKGE